MNLLSSDDDMLAMLLTDQYDAKIKNTQVPFEKHAEVELLLENYQRQLSYSLQELSLLLRRVQTKQELSAITLDVYRNRMIQMNVNLAIAGVR